MRTTTWGPGDYATGRAIGGHHDPRRDDGDPPEIVGIVEAVKELADDAQKAIGRRDDDKAERLVDEIRATIGSDPALIAALDNIVKEVGALLPAHLLESARKALKESA